MTRFCYMLLLACLSLPTCAHALERAFPSQPTDLERQFVATVERAITTTNIAALTALDYTPGLPAGASAAINGSFYRTMIERGCVSLRLERADPAVATEHKDSLGGTIRENLPVRWILTISHPSPVPGGKVTTQVRAGLFDGRIRFTQPEEKK